MGRRSPAAEAYAVPLTIVTEDRPGMLAEIAAAVAEVGSNIVNVEARTADGRGPIDLVVEIPDMKHLERVIASIQRIDGVYDVTRSPTNREPDQVDRRTMTKRVIRTSLGPPAIGAYSQAIVSGNLIFVSGQIPLDPATGNLIEEKDIKSQTRRVLLNLQGVLKGAGVSLENVVKTTVFLKNMRDFAEFNSVYAEFFNVGSAGAFYCRGRPLAQRCRHRDRLHRHDGARIFSSI